MGKIVFPLPGGIATYQGEAYKLEELPYLDHYTPGAPVEPRARAIAPDGRNVEIYWYSDEPESMDENYNFLDSNGAFIFDCLIVSNETISGILELEED